jgi:hypothetical protein
MKLMKGYQKAAVFIAVLLFSVSLISAAIDILGDITDVDLDDDRFDTGADRPSEAGDAERTKGEEVEVDSKRRGSAYPLFKIYMQPQTRYLRQSVGEIYEGGKWRLSEDSQHVKYLGEELRLNVSGYDSVEQVTFLVEPLINISGFVPATLSVYRIGFKGTLDRYPHLEAFHSAKPSSSRYWVSYANHEFSELMLRLSSLSHHDDYLDVPETSLIQLKGLASQITEDSFTQWEKLKALEEYLRDEYKYDEDYIPAPSDVDPVEWFLFHEYSGVCEHFNSAFVLLARSIGLPARLVNGYLVDANADVQTVMPEQAHVYAEAQFRNIGWITFDATPEGVEERLVSISRIPTETNITDNDDVGIKGGHFNVYGTVMALNGSPVDEVFVQVFLKISKNETGILCGMGEVVNGFFDITCEASTEIDVGDYMLVAHSLGNEFFEGSWSDPPIRIIAETEAVLDAPSYSYVGKNVTFKGKLVEKSSGQPITDLNVSIEIGDKTIKKTTDEHGDVTILHVFENEGNQNVTMSFENSDFYLGSNYTVGIAIKIPPQSGTNLLEVLTVFPYNVAIVGSCATALLVTLFVRRSRLRPLPEEVEYDESTIELTDDSISFDTYKVGIVKLFNRFYAVTQIRFGDVENHLTPREFQSVLLDKISRKGVHALDDLVSNFEIANYSEVYPPKESYDRCQEAVELLKGLMEDG